MEAIGKLLEHLGYTAPLLYAAAAYGLFHWLDENLSDAAKALLASTMKLKDYRKEQVASALVEVFDRIYTRPLLSWRAFARSLLFTVLVSVLFALEVWRKYRGPFVLAMLHGWLIALSFNVLTDYLALFVIRPLLIRSGTKAVTGLTLAAVSGAAIVLLGNALRELEVLIELIVVVHHGTFEGIDFVQLFLFFAPYMWPAIIVFSWLPVLALGILIIRALTPLSWVVAAVQWALREGDRHPLKAIGCVAAVAVFAVTVGLRTMITT